MTSLLALTAAWAVAVAIWLSSLRREPYRNDFLLTLFSAVMAGLTGGIFLAAWSAP